MKRPTVKPLQGHKLSLKLVNPPNLLAFQPSQPQPIPPKSFFQVGLKYAPGIFRRQRCGRTFINHGKYGRRTARKH